MTMQECDKRNIAILENALKWASGGSCDHLTQLDVALLCDCLQINMPVAFVDFISSDNPNHCRAYKNHKIILKTLEKIKNKIDKGELTYRTIYGTEL